MKFTCGAADLLLFVEDNMPYARITCQALMDTSACSKKKVFMSESSSETSLGTLFFSSKFISAVWLRTVNLH
jgi:hypothetical protein